MLLLHLKRGGSTLDAFINIFVVVYSLRQFFRNDGRIHGIIPKGGETTNVVPAYCEAGFLLRVSTMEELTVIRKIMYTAVPSCHRSYRCMD